MKTMNAQDIMYLHYMTGQQLLCGTLGGAVHIISAVSLLNTERDVGIQNSQKVVCFACMFVYGFVTVFVMHFCLHSLC